MPELPGPCRPRPPLGVFWDIENCNIPRGKSAVAVCEKIRSQDFFLDHSELQFAVVCDAAKESTSILDDLHKAQVKDYFLFIRCSFYDLFFIRCP